MNWSCWKMYASKMKFVYAVCIWICLSGFDHSAADEIIIKNHEGDQVTITCTHFWASDNKKYFCRDPCNNKDILVSSDQTSNGRIRLKDLGKGTFTVTITDLEESDSGIYWCRVRRLVQDTYNKVNLKVYKVFPQETSYIQNLLDQLEKITVLDLTNVTMDMDKVFSTSEKINTSSDDPKKQASDVLKVSEKLVSTLVKSTNTYANVSFTRAAVEAHVFVVGPQANLDKIPQLNTLNASIDIDLIGIARNNLNLGSAAVAFMSYSTMEDLLKPDFFNTSDNTVKTMMSTVISATLPKTTNKTLTKPVNFTLRHIRKINDSGNLSCVYWNISEWIVDGCSVVKINSSYTVCSCVHLSTFALIMQTSRSPSEDNSQPMESMNMVFVIVCLVFTSLALLTFAFCRWKPGVNNVARINLCISLLSAHLLFLLTQQFINLIKPHKELCAVISGALHFFFLSCFVWMFIEAVLLFICVKNISQISSRQRAMLNKGFLIVIGYAIDFVIVGVSAGLVPEGYGSEKCWIKVERGFIWSFLGPVCFILAINMILFISIIISLNLTLKNLNLDVSHIRQTKITVFKTLAQFVIFGCPWFLGFFITNSKMIEILFLILNSQQGTFIFLVYCVLNNEVRQQYVKWMRAVFPGHRTKYPISSPHPKN
ncbi:adhesion G protein-coupled receptor E3-like [Paramisgurnus dabryanus]|uniref:adhesion G protein-coupled receptor E3-like n=1 Tax=Paramisgurnus dabryanus TaxID=90735 RepID=UPI0031F37E78